MSVYKKKPDKVRIVTHTALNFVMTCKNFETKQHFKFNISLNFNLGNNFILIFYVTIYRSFVSPDLLTALHNDFCILIDTQTHARTKSFFVFVVSFIGFFHII